MLITHKNIFPKASHSKTFVSPKRTFPPKAKRVLGCCFAHRTPPRNQAAGRHHDRRYQNTKKMII